MNTALAEAITFHQELDGVRYDLPGRSENPIRRQAGMLLIVIGASDGFICTTLVGVVLATTANVPDWAIALIVLAILASSAIIIVLGLWFMSARTRIFIGRDTIRSVTRLGPLRRTRRARIDQLERLSLSVERMKGVNMPGAREGDPSFLTLRAHVPSPRRRGDNPGIILATGYHTRLLTPLAQDLAARLGVNAPSDPESAPESQPPGALRR